ncbi:MAG: hypothetical protein VCF25_13845 [Candidatus Poribacteria bacterium]
MPFPTNACLERVAFGLTTQRSLTVMGIDNADHTMARDELSISGYTPLNGGMYFHVWQ